MKFKFGDKVTLLNKYRCVVVQDPTPNYAGDDKEHWHTTVVIEGDDKVETEWNNMLEPGWPKKRQPSKDRRKR